MEVHGTERTLRCAVAFRGGKSVRMARCFFGRLVETRLSAYRYHERLSYGTRIRGVEKPGARLVGAGVFQAVGAELRKWRGKARAKVARVFLNAMPTLPFPTGWARSGVDQERCLTAHAGR